jgi:nicotinamidase-related amidase
VPEALLIMDFQGGFLGLFDDPGPVVAQAAAALDAARRAGTPVVHLRVAFPPDGPPVPAANRMFGQQFRGRMLEGSDDVAVPDALAPRPGEPVVTRRRTGRRRRRPGPRPPRRGRRLRGALHVDLPRVPPTSWP